MIRYALEKKLGKPVHVRMKVGHMQEAVVNERLMSEGEREGLLKKLEAYGVLERGARI